MFYTKNSNKYPGLLVLAWPYFFYTKGGLVDMCIYICNNYYVYIYMYRACVLNSIIGVIKWMLVLMEVPCCLLVFHPLHTKLLWSVVVLQ